MVTYVQRQYGGDPNRVYATGSSSGGMMTNEMLALYPDVFKAGAAFMGVPFNCFSGAADYPPGSSKCTGGGMDRTPQQWGDAVRQAYPGYTGPRPRVQLWHGTSDTLVPYSLLQETIEQWTNVFGLSQTPTSSDFRLWLKFLGRETAFYMGAEKMAQATRYATFFVGMRRTSKGHYAIEFVPLCAAGEKLPEGEITERYARLVEAEIRAAPADWTWTHRRWRLKPPLYGERTQGPG
jgi:hypothetical protein